MSNRFVAGRNRYKAAASRLVTAAVKRATYVKGLNQRQKKQVKRFIRGVQELKYHQVANSINLDTTWQVLPLTAVPQGDTDITRDGDKLSLCGNLSMRLFSFVDVSGDPAQQLPMMRFIIFQWHPQSDTGAAPTIGNIITTGASGVQDETSLYNHDTRQQYTILKDITYRLSGPGTSAANAYNTMQTKTMHLEIPLLKIRGFKKWMQFQAASTTIATNHIYLAAGANVVNDAQNPIFNYVTKVFYRDS